MTLVMGPWSVPCPELPRAAYVTREHFAPCLGGEGLRVLERRLVRGLVDTCVENLAQSASNAHDELVLRFVELVPWRAAPAALRQSPRRATKTSVGSGGTPRLSVAAEQSRIRVAGELERRQSGERRRGLVPLP
eukprot:scaffold221303_cov34-Tisochrysis_lutea.AAC.1